MSSDEAKLQEFERTVDAEVEKLLSSRNADDELDDSFYQALEKGLRDAGAFGDLKPLVRVGPDGNAKVEVQRQGGLLDLEVPAVRKRFLVTQGLTSISAFGNGVIYGTLEGKQQYSIHNVGANYVRVIIYAYTTRFVYISNGRFHVEHEYGHGTWV